MHLLCVYKAGEIIPFGMHLCHSYSVGEDSLVLYHDDMMTTIVHYDHFDIFDANTLQEKIAMIDAIQDTVTILRGLKK